MSILLCSQYYDQQPGPYMVDASIQVNEFGEWKSLLTMIKGETPTNRYVSGQVT